MKGYAMLAGWKFSNFKDRVFAEYFHVNDADGNLALIPDEIDDITTTMLCDMMPTGFHGVELAEVAFGDNDTFITAVKVLKPGGRIGNVNYLGEGDYVRIPRAEWGSGMEHKTIVGGLMPGGRLRMEKLLDLVKAGRVDPSKLVTHKFDGFDHVEEVLLMIKDKPSDLIKPIVIIK